MQVLTTVEYANTYMNTKPDATEWTALVATDKVKWLNESSRQIYAIPCIEIPVFGQGDEIPDDLQQACCEVVLSLLTSGNDSNPHMVNKKLGISSISFGKDSVSYGDASISAFGLDSAIFNDYAQSLLSKYMKRAYRYV